MEKQILRRTFIFYVKKKRNKKPPEKQHFIFYSKYVANTNRISFPMQSPSFLCLSCVEDKKCLTCSRNLDGKRKPCNFGEKRW